MLRNRIDIEGERSSQILTCLLVPEERTYAPLYGSESAHDAPDFLISILRAIKVRMLILQACRYSRELSIEGNEVSHSDALLDEWQRFFKVVTSDFHSCTRF